MCVSSWPTMTATASWTLDEAEVEEFIRQFPAGAFLAPPLVDDEAMEDVGHEERARVVAELFRALDVDSEGKIPKSEMLSAGGAGLAEQIEEAFDRADADGDGRLDRAEAERFLALMGNRLGDDAAATEEAGADDWADEDNVEVEELIGKFPAAALRAAAEDDDAEEEGEEGDDAVAEMFRALDGNSDGKIEKHEILEPILQQDAALATAAEEIFGRADEDGDRSLDRTEAETFLVLFGEEVEEGAEEEAQEAENQAENQAEGDDAASNADA